MKTLTALSNHNSYVNDNDKAPKGICTQKFTGQY
uniref:Uncharacterized protein n=1 Tax=Rhizophora mucronata TaxID=61149 RepID=A0A2P2QIS4_RHIMU